MMASSSRHHGRRNILLIALALTLAAGVVGYRIAASQEPVPIPGRGTQIRNVSPSWSFDVGDKRRLAGFSTDVFIGRVVGQAGTEGRPTSKPGTTLPYTQFTVEVLHNLKGDATGTVTVSQEGGYIGDELVLVNNDPLLTAGRTYLLVTVHSAEKGWYQIVAPGPGNLAIADAAQRATLVGEFERAVREQIPYDRTTRRFADGQR